MTHFLGQGGQFRVYKNGALTPYVTLSDEQVLQLITLHLAQAELTSGLILLSERYAQSLPAGRQLLNQHKALRQLPHSPHHR